MAGTELDTAAAVAPPFTTPALFAVELVEVVRFDSEVDIKVLGSGGGKEPPDKNEGHSERSSGSDEEAGER